MPAYQKDTNGRKGALSLKNWVLATGIVRMLNDEDTEGRVEDLVDKIDQLIDERFASKSEDIQSAVVGRVLLHACYCLMKEKPDDYKMMLGEQLSKLRSK